MKQIKLNSTYLTKIEYDFNNRITGCFANDICISPSINHCYKDKTHKRYFAPDDDNA